MYGSLIKKKKLFLLVSDSLYTFILSQVLDVTEEDLEYAGSLIFQVNINTFQCRAPFSF